jgi:hypothetical protein
MRNIESSPWLAAPELIEIRSVALDKQKVNEFTLAMQVKRAASAGDAKAGTTPPGKGPPGKAPAKSASASAKDASA